MSTAPVVGARPGRPRDPSRDVAIVEATLELLAELGYAALTVEAVAARAGVGKATLYRRWPGKEALVVDALAGVAADPVEADDDAPVLEQLVALLEAVQRRSGTLAGRLFSRLLTDAMDHPELARRYREQVVAPRRRRFLLALQRAVEEGLVRRDVDLEHAVDLLVGAVTYRNLVRTDPPVPPDFARRVVDDVLRGLSPRPEVDPS